MTRDTYLYLCHEADAGRDAFVTHPGSLEEGRLASCVMSTDHMIVEKPDGTKSCWDFHECEELWRMKNLRPGR